MPPPHPFPDSSHSAIIPSVLEPGCDHAGPGLLPSVWAPTEPVDSYSLVGCASACMGTRLVWRSPQAVLPPAEPWGRVSPRSRGLTSVPPWGESPLA